jgi:chromosome segregation ATPase
MELKKARLAELEKDKKEKEQTLIDQSDMYKGKLVVEYERFDSLQADYEEIKLSSVDKVNVIEASIEGRVEKITTEFDSKLAHYEEEVKVREAGNLDKVKSMEEILNQTEVDADKEIIEMKTRYENELKAERETLVKVRGELGILKKKHGSAQRDLDSHKGNIDWMNKEQTRLKTEVKTSEKDKVELKKEIKGRDTTILEKEKEITQLKKELRHVENTRQTYIFSLTTC